MDNKEVAHLWANQSRDAARGSSFYFDGDTIYSYGSHFPVARHYKGAVLFTSRSYSNTTARHKSITRSACSHLEVFTVANPSENPSRKDVANYGDSIKRLSLVASNSRNTAAALEALESEIREANTFCDRFGFKARFAMPQGEELDALKAKAKASAERERKAKIAREAKQEREAQETIQQWLGGAGVSVPQHIQKTYLRVVESDLQTSKGARVPLDEAHKAFRFAVAKRAHGWKRNGEQFQVGSYQLDAVNEQGIIAGCHRITWGEVERFAKAQGW